MSDDFPVVRAAVVQAAPILFDREATVAKACRLVSEAATQGAQLILFPEAFIPAYPRGLSFGTVVGSRSPMGRCTWQRYWTNAVDVPGPVTDTLGASARQAGVYLAMGVTERDNQFSRGTLYCTLLYFAPDGRLIGKHRKLKPTAAERLIWGEGDGSTLTVLETEFGKVGGLICWENYMPLARMAMYSKGVELYLAPTADSRDTWQATLCHIACEGRCFVLGCNQFVTKDMYPEDLEGLDDLADQPEVMCRGGSAIISPLGEVLAGPLYDQEGVLFADLDLAEIARSKLDFDVVGHYSRPDIFQLIVNERPAPPVVHKRESERGNDMTMHIEPPIAAAYGGEGWSPRTQSLAEELGREWGSCGVASEWSRLKAVLLHRPGPELTTSADPDAVQMLELLDLERAQAQHDAIAQAYKEAGVVVHYVEPGKHPPPNQMFIADLMFMTPEGAILARPASIVRAGEERWVARRLADLSIPILRSVRGKGTFEGADAAWIDPQTVMIGRGLRTNDEGAAQVASTLAEMGVKVIQVDLPYGSMHLMGMLRFVDHDLAIGWPTRLVHRGVEALKRYGFRVVFIPDETEAARGKALNFVTLGPHEILMTAGNPLTQAFYESLGITCRVVDVNELGKAAGAIGCLTGILERVLVF